MELDLQRLFGLHVHRYSLAKTPHLGSIRGRCWSAKIDDISLWPPDLEPSSPIKIRIVYSVNRQISPEPLVILKLMSGTVRYRTTNTVPYRTLFIKFDFRNYLWYIDVSPYSNIGSGSGRYLRSRTGPKEGLRISVNYVGTYIRIGIQLFQMVLDPAPSKWRIAHFYVAYLKLVKFIVFLVEKIWVLIKTTCNLNTHFVTTAKMIAGFI